MIAFLKGELIEARENRAVVEVGGIGYNVFVTIGDAQKLQRGKEVLLHTYLQVREDAMLLFGFLAKDDLEMFRLLLGVNGIGPKAALGILSGMSARDLRFAVLAGDAKTIAKAPGIGAKTAQKMILELKDKFNLEETLEQTETAVSSDGLDDSRSEAVQALTALGYSGSDALKAVRAVEVTDGMTTEDILKASLKKMAW